MGAAASTSSTRGSGAAASTMRSSGAARAASPIPGRACIGAWMPHVARSGRRSATRWLRLLAARRRAAACPRHVARRRRAAPASVALCGAWRSGTRCGSHWTCSWEAAMAAPRCWRAVCPCPGRRVSQMLGRCWASSTAPTFSGRRCGGSLSGRSWGTSPSFRCRGRAGHCRRRFAGASAAPRPRRSRSGASRLSCSMASRFPWSVASCRARWRCSVARPMWTSPFWTPTRVARKWRCWSCSFLAGLSVGSL
mmetsp:Transcript_121685/g.351294  ORF Transcript_121685/g.351294 Transcript_121685/m.351294 type:complete len:252 (-) Transcript_121685:257-1012(-)